MMGQSQFGVPGEGEGTLGALRLATAAAHARIERVLGLDGAFSLPHYVRVLQGFDCFLAAWEPAVTDALPLHLQPWFDARRRGPLVVQDLVALGAVRVLRPLTLPSLASPAAALGSLYVMEGSALGGQVIARRLRTALGIGTQDGAAYFTGWGERTGTMWREFRHILATEVHEEPARAAACTAAVATFDTLTATFEACLHEPAVA